MAKKPKTFPTYKWSSLKFGKVVIMRGLFGITRKGVIIDKYACGHDRTLWIAPESSENGRPRHVHKFETQDWKDAAQFHERNKHYHLIVNVSQ